MTRKSATMLQMKQKPVLEEEIELLDGASAEFDQELVDAGELLSSILWLPPS